MLYWLVKTITSVIKNGHFISKKTGYLHRWQRISRRFIEKLWLFVPHPSRSMLVRFRDINLWLSRAIDGGDLKWREWHPFKGAAALKDLGWSIRWKMTGESRRRSYRCGETCIHLQCRETRHPWTASLCTKSPSTASLHVVQSEFMDRDA